MEAERLIQTLQQRQGIWRDRGKIKQSGNGLAKTEQGKSKDAEAGLGLTDCKEVCPKGCVYGLCGEGCSKQGHQGQLRDAMKPGRGAWM